MVKIQTKQFRPPIVTLMGHINHGKTTLLDKIRSSRLWQKEIGGITQHIRAYQVQVKSKDKQQSHSITFIDTPGHAAFVNMRHTGSQVTDLVVLVVSAAEGIKTQTKECLKLIEKNKIPFIVAINKIDLKTASVDKVKGQLVELGYNPEDYGGQIACIPLSAKTGQGIDNLLDMILLNAEILELESFPQKPLRAFVIESKMDKNRGPLASLVVKQGTLAVGDTVYSLDHPAKIKALIGPSGQPLKKIGPGDIAEVLGFAAPPAVASQITSTPLAANPVLPSSSPLSTPASGKQLNIVVKADTNGTLRALLNSFSDDVVIITSGVGQVGENDVFLAESSGAQIFSFNQKTPSFIQKLAKNQQVRLFESSIIYEIIDDINAQVLKILEPTIDETIVGEGKIIQQFLINKRRIAGIKCTKGELSAGVTIHLKRGDDIIKNSSIDSIQQGKLQVDKIKLGSECGITFKPHLDFHLNDVIISYYKTKEQ